MTDEEMHDLMAVGALQADGDRDATKAQWKKVPARTRGLIAALVLAAKDKPVNKRRVAEVGGFDRKIFQKAKGLEWAIDYAGPLIEFMLNDARPSTSVTDLQSKLQERDATIARLRKDLADQKAATTNADRYAREMYKQVKPRYDANVKEREQKVVDLDERRHLTVVQTGDGDCSENETRHSATDE